MRALRVVGLAEDGKSVVCEDAERGDRFLVPADDRLRAAARGDITRLGQAKIELESQMRPREIQTRIRAGESVDQVAAAAGIPANRVERFAYPVLLERSRTAELAQRAHPIREDGPDVQTLGEVASHAFNVRGQDYTEATWNSWRGDDGKWVVQLRWRAGRSDIRAHWAFHPGAHGGTVTPLDEHAVDLLDPNPNRPLRTVAVRPVTELAKQPVEQPVAEARPRQAVVGGQPAHHEPPHHEPRVEARVESPPETHRREPEPQPEPAPVVHEEPAPREPTRARVDTIEENDTELASYEPVTPPPPAEPTPEPEPVVREEPAAREPETKPEPEPALQTQPEPAAPKRRTKSKKNRPTVPSWDEVLLGTRSNRG
ncbi:DUF3071 family protein [Herbihabitans rhizosphaerae]|uniref:DUF3071 family protein n=1 Tax=Herbihabitans rhizosphaerae TaxID=1872711 RepID=A0A4V2ETG5_9PSEU|nr:septation protein SepH [Herbihabitans rhizosphaerae]RZS40993.1 DUF3071 family protein [Herbihabitans rhizosphaerae]